jgi:hypothetical protein
MARKEKIFTVEANNRDKGKNSKSKKCQRARRRNGLFVLRVQLWAQV